MQSQQRSFYPNLDEHSMEQQQQQQPQSPNEEIPLRNFNRSVSETPERVRVRRIFNRWDTDGDGYLSIPEMKRLVRSNQCNDMPRGVARRVLTMADQDGDGRLDFEEFFQLSQEHEWLVGHYVARYCHLIVPHPHREQTVPGVMASDQIDGARAAPSYFSRSIYSSTIDGQYERSMTFCPPPLTMIVFSLIEIAFFVVDIIFLKEDIKKVHEIGHSTHGPMATLFIYHPYRRFEAWRFATYMFVHIGVMHLVMNLVVQIFLGIALELVHCWWRVSLVYVAGVVAGSMGVSLASPYVFLAGASGGVYALITAHIATIVMNYREMEYAIVQLFVFLCYIVIDIGTAVYRQFTEQHDQVSYVSHLCGALAGLLVGIGVLRNLKVRRWERILWWVAVIIYFVLMTTGICIHIFLPDRFPMQHKRDMYA